jgi:hypothetical protein
VVDRDVADNRGSGTGFTSWSITRARKTRTSSSSSKTELALDRLPTEKGKVPENKVNLIGEIEPFAARSMAGKAFNLTAGKYVLICNIAEVEDGKLESHYELGMRTSFVVQ